MQKIHTKNRFLNNFITTSKSKKLIKNLTKIEPDSMNSYLPIVWNKSKGSSIYDINGNKFIDFTSTIFVTNIGHSNDKLVKNLKKGLDKNLLHTYIYPHRLRNDYINKLLKFSGNIFDKAFLLSSGTESTEAALKLMKLYGIKKKKKKKIYYLYRGKLAWENYGRPINVQQSKTKKMDWKCEC